LRWRVCVRGHLAAKAEGGSWVWQPDARRPPASVCVERHAIRTTSPFFWTSQQGYRSRMRGSFSSCVARRGRKRGLPRRHMLPAVGSLSTAQCPILTMICFGFAEISQKMRDDLERLKKIRNHRGLRHYWGLRVRGQHTKTTGRRGKTVGVSKKKG
jgi:hypothetical protein